jgi:hypothetical protein
MERLAKLQDLGMYWLRERIFFINYEEHYFCFMLDHISLQAGVK